MKRIRKFFAISLLFLLGICVVLSTVSAISNSTLSQYSPIIETLSEADKTRLAESLHLREQLGNDIFPGWGAAAIPVILYNEEYAFLIGYSNPPDGWMKVPARIVRGEAWEPVLDDSFMGQPYYRQRLSDPGITPEAFTVMVGDRWVASLQTLDWFQISLTRQIRDDLPSFIQPIFPYRLFLEQLISSSDQYISLIAHELFHSYQGVMTPQKFADAEIVNQYADQYPWDDLSLQADWQIELDLLADALRSTDSTLTIELARQFLALRATRRESANLSAELIVYEQQREWLEGLARYAELEIWRQTHVSDYVPLKETDNLTDFNHYAGFERRWSRELDQLTKMAGDPGDGRFYYTGMAQAYLLDQLMPDWKLQAFDDKVLPEDLLRAATQFVK